MSHTDKMFHVNTPVFSAFFLWLFHLLKQNTFVYIFNYYSQDTMK